MESKALATLVETAAKGDPKAFAEIYAKFSRSVYYLGLRMTRNEYDANDIVQETMVRLYENLPKLKNSAAVGSFVNRTAYNCCIDLIRAKKTEFSTDEEVLENVSISDEEFIPEKFVETEELRKKVVEMIDNLNDDQRSAVLMFYYEELSINQIAEITSVSEQVVKTRLWRARNAIKDSLKATHLKEVLVFAMATPALTRLLSLDSKASFTNEVSSLNWQMLSEKLKYTPEIISTTMGIANSGVATNTASTAASAVTTAATAGKIGLGKAAMIIAAATIATGSLGYGAYSIVNNDAKRSSIIDETLNSAPNISQSIELDVPVADIPQAVTGSSSSVDTGGSEADSYGSASPTVSPEKLAINVESSLLRYSVGSDVSPEQIVNDANITIIDKKLSVKLDYFDLVDFDKAGEYAIYIYAENEEGEILSQNVLILTIEHK